MTEALLRNVHPLEADGIGNKRPIRVPELDADISEQRASRYRHGSALLFTGQ
jgi:hypothetical protein